MDAQLVKGFRDRWQEIEAIEIEEQPMVSGTLRWQQLNAIFRLAVGLGIPLSGPDEEEESVRLRWAKLKGVDV